MPNFCPNCGQKLLVPNPNFCPNCGFDLRGQENLVSSILMEKEEEVAEEAIEKRAWRAIYELGEKLEECIEAILAARGFKTQRRVRLRGSSGASHEIDVLAHRGSIAIAVECKNWKEPVGKKIVEEHYARLKDLNPKWDGVIASFVGFTEDARNFAEYYGIKLWEPDYLKEEFFKVFVGRVEEAKFEKPIKVENALPLKNNFLDVSETKLRNEDKIMRSGTLSFHPYYVVSYSYYAKFKDPTKEVHKFKDEGKVFIDALDGTVLNSPPVKDIVGVARKLKSVISKQEREESRRTKKLIEEIGSGLKALSNYDVKMGESYRVIKFPPSISKRSYIKSAIDYIIQKNTEEIRYTPKSQKDEFLPETKTVTYVPKVRNINIKSVTLVYVPKWEINYEAFSKTYAREVLAFSGTILEDSLRHCPKHIGFMKKETVAVCEVCGQALCDAHVFQCPICGKWLCEDDGKICEDCKRIYCIEHPLIKCEVCGRPLCNDCKLTCPICGKTYGHKHARTCDNCGKTVCENCATSIGFIRRRTLCKECQKTQL
ncbi:MAG: restriction endonuclease [Candidatus Bathycorpusculaceae bacterium]